MFLEQKMIILFLTVTEYISFDIFIISSLLINDVKTNIGIQTFLLIAHLLGGDALLEGP